MSEKKDYFDYVVNILGVKSLLLNQETTGLLQVVPLLVCVEDYASYTGTEKDLLAKMIGALKIDLNLIKVIDLNQRAIFQSEFSVYFLEDVNNRVIEVNRVQTHSPRFLLKNPQYKKQAWEDLQKLILHFNQARI